VTVPDDSLVDQHPEFTAGTEVTLDESNTEIFVRSRDTETSQSAIARLGRQKIYIRAFVDRQRSYTQKMRAMQRSCIRHSHHIW